MPKFKRYINTSIRFDAEIKEWIYQKAHAESISLNNLINDILKREKERENLINHMWHTVNITIPSPHKRYLFYDDQAGQEFEDYGNTIKSYTYFREL